MPSPDRFPNPPDAPRDQDQLRPKILESLKKTLEDLETIAFADRPTQGNTQERIRSVFDWLQDLAEGRDGIPEGVEESTVAALLDRLKVTFEDLAEAAEGKTLPEEAIDRYTEAVIEPYTPSPEAGKITEALEKLSQNPRTDVNAILFCFEQLNIGTPESIELRRTLYRNSRSNTLEFDTFRLVAGLHNIPTEEAVTLIEELLDDGSIAKGQLDDLLLRNGTPTAMRLRERLIQDGFALIAMPSLGYVDNPEATRLRNIYLAQARKSCVAVFLSLTGLDTSEAFQLRRQLMRSEPVTKELLDAAVLSLCDTKRYDSIKLRRELIALGAPVDKVIKTLHGISTRESMLLRAELLSEQTMFAIAHGIRDVDTPESETLREAFFTLATNKTAKHQLVYHALAQSFSGTRSIGSFRQRNKLLQVAKSDVLILGYLAEGIIGIGTPESIEFRRSLMEKGARIKDITNSLRQANTKEAMDFRHELLQNNPDPEIEALIIESLAGVDNKEAHDFRRARINSPYSHAVIKSMYGTGSQESMEIRAILLGPKKEYLRPVGESLQSVYTDASFAFREAYYRDSPGDYIETLVDTEPLYCNSP